MEYETSRLSAWKVTHACAFTKLPKRCPRVPCRNIPVVVAIDVTSRIGSILPGDGHLIACFKKMFVPKTGNSSFIRAHNSGSSSITSDKVAPYTFRLQVVQDVN